MPHSESSEISEIRKSSRDRQSGVYSSGTRMMAVCKEVLSSVLSRDRVSCSDRLLGRHSRALSPLRQTPKKKVCKAMMAVEVDIR